MSGSSRSRQVLLDPRAGDRIKAQNGNTYQVVGRGPASSVRFVRESGGHRLMGQKSLACWQRLVRSGEVLA